VVADWVDLSAIDMDVVVIRLEETAKYHKIYSGKKVGPSTGIMYCINIA